MGVITTGKRTCPIILYFLVGPIYVLFLQKAHW